MTEANIGDTITLLALEKKKGGAAGFVKRLSGEVTSATVSSDRGPAVIIGGNAQWIFLNDFDQVHIVPAAHPQQSPTDQQLLATVLHTQACGCADWEPGDVEDTQYDEMADAAIATGFATTPDVRTVAAATRAATVAEVRRNFPPTGSFENQASQYQALTRLVEAG